jgi:protein-disulfide isomerase
MPPPLPPGPLGHPYKQPEKPPKVVIELFHDLTCPFCKKMMDSLKEVLPEYETKHPGAIQWLYCNVVQTWHPQSALCHEACMAVSEVKKEAVWDFVHAFMDKQEDYFDDKVRSKTPNDIYQELATLAEGATGAPKADVLAKLALKGTGNSGCYVSQLMKWYTKMHRVRGVHVTPTVFVNGTEAPHVESGWTPAQWKEFLDSLLA